MGRKSMRGRVIICADFEPILDDGTSLKMKSHRIRAPLNPAPNWPFISCTTHNGRFDIHPRSTSDGGLSGEVRSRIRIEPEDEM